MNDDTDQYNYYDQQNQVHANQGYQSLDTDDFDEL